MAPLAVVGSLLPGYFRRQETGAAIFSGERVFLDWVPFVLLALDFIEVSFLNPKARSSYSFSNLSKKER
jgi:hypothetical protein